MLPFPLITSATKQRSPTAAHIVYCYLPRLAAVVARLSDKTSCQAMAGLMQVTAR